MSVMRSLVFLAGRTLNRSRLPLLCGRMFTGLYTLYKAKDLASFGRGSSIQPFVILQGSDGIHMGSGTHLRAGCRVQTEPVYPASPGAPAQKPILRIGDGTLVERFCHITAKERIEIGERVLMGEGILITDHDHGFEDTTEPPRDCRRPSRGPRASQLGACGTVGSPSLRSMSTPEVGNPPRLREE